jgi:hypothetical protein
MVTGVPSLGIHATGLTISHPGKALAGQAANYHERI